LRRGQDILNHDPLAALTGRAAGTLYPALAAGLAGIGGQAESRPDPGRMKNIYANRARMTGIGSLLEM